MPRFPPLDPALNNMNKNDIHVLNEETNKIVDATTDCLLSVQMGIIKLFVKCVNKNNDFYNSWGFRRNREF